MGAPLTFFSPFFLKIFLAFADRILPVTRHEDLPADTEETARRAEILILEQERTKRFLLKFFLVFFQYFSVFFSGKPFTSLSTNQKIQYMKRIEAAPISKIRLGFWGLKTFVYWGYYTQTKTWPGLHYGGPLVKQ